MDSWRAREGALKVEVLSRVLQGEWADSRGRQVKVETAGGERHYGVDLTCPGRVAWAGEQGRGGEGASLGAGWLALWFPSLFRREQRS